ncbi:MAG: hypothetical protein ACR2QO_17125 [Acidimicrobiales bacterium]
MNLRIALLVVCGWGIATVGALVAGFATVGGLLAFVHLGGLIGAPLAVVMHRRLRSVPVAIALSVALSLALSALAAQSLTWFEGATDVLIVVVATAYGVALAYLLGERAADEFGLG